MVWDGWKLLCQVMTEGQSLNLNSQQLKVGRMTHDGDWKVNMRGLGQVGHLLLMAVLLM